MKRLLYCLFLISNIAFSQTANFTYQYHNEITRGGKFKFIAPDRSLIFEASASAGYLGAANNPYFQMTKNVGPLPNGTWEIYAVKNDSKAILRLRPTDDVVMPTDSNGKPFRDGFLIHGVNENQTADQASAGCIILDPTNRKILLVAFKKYGVIKLTVANIVTGDDVH